MLDPKYFQRLKSTLTQLGEATVEVDKEPLPVGFSFKVIAYSQVEDFALIQWRRGSDSSGEYISGENLWQKESPIATTGGRLRLEEIPAVVKTGTNYRTIWDTVQIPDKALPIALAKALRDPSNLRPMTVG
jgi:hypothetical protein